MSLKVIGPVTVDTDPEERTFETKAGKTLHELRFKVACDRSLMRFGYDQVDVFNADYILGPRETTDLLKKGDQIFIQGDLIVSQWTSKKDGSPMRRISIKIDQLSKVNLAATPSVSSPSESSSPVSAADDDLPF